MPLDRPALQEFDELLRRPQPHVGDGLAELRSHQNADPARLHGSKRILIRKVIAEICNRGVLRRLRQHSLYGVVLVAPDRAKLEAAVERQQLEPAFMRDRLPQLSRAAAELFGSRLRQTTPVQRETG